VFCLDVVSN